MAPSADALIPSPIGYPIHIEFDDVVESFGDEFDPDKNSKCVPHSTKKEGYADFDKS